MSRDEAVPSLRQFELEAEANDGSNVEIGRNVARLRKERGLSQQDLADQMRAAGRDHWRQNTVSRIETGKQGIGYEDMEPLGELLGDILAGTETGKRIRQSMRGLEKTILSHRLARLESSLQDALDGVQELRMAYDQHYRDDNPELRDMLLGEGGDDGERQEED